MKSKRLQEIRFIVTGVVLLTMSVLLFARLGHYALWDDEAATALAAKGVLRTGDTSVVLDHGNICAYRNGWDVRNFCDHSIPPLGAYLAATSFGLFGVDAFTARLPFALLGLATFGLILFWSRRECGPFPLVLALGLLGNVSLFLFLRQSRYYAPSIFLSCAIVFIYWREKPTPRVLLTLAALSILLFLSNYMEYLALYVGLAIDYAFWKRKEWPFSWRSALLLLGPQVLCNGMAACIWNPFLTPHGASETANSLGDRLTLFYWYWRDMDRCEFFVLPVLGLALYLGLKQRRAWLVRGCVAILVYVAVVTLVSPQPMDRTSQADVRYLAPTIPLAVALEASVICLLLPRHHLLSVLAAAAIFGTNLFHFQSLGQIGFRSTILSYMGELLHPPPEPYTPTAQWINDHVPEGDSVWVLPGFATYPLMFHAPRALYAWQLDWPPRPDFTGLPRIQFKGQEPPDFLIAFGPSVKEMAEEIRSLHRPGLSYERVTSINVLWENLNRPELFWHTFVPITDFDPDTQAIYIFRRTNPPISAP